MPSTLLQTGSPLPTSQRPEKAPSHSTSAVGATALARRAARSASLPSTDGPTSPCPQPALPHRATCRCPGNLGSSVLDTQASGTVCGEGAKCAASHSGQTQHARVTSTRPQTEQGQPEASHAPSGTAPNRDAHVQRRLLASRGRAEHALSSGPSPLLFPL